MTAAGAKAALLAKAGEAADDALDLAEVALLLASLDRPGVSLSPYRRLFASLAEGVRGYVAGAPDGVALRAEALAQIIHKRFGFGGHDDVFDDADASNLMRCIDRRLGLPVVLGLLYIDTAQKLGWAAGGMAFPSRFLLSLELAGERAVIDPFDGGRVLNVAGLRGLIKTVVGHEAELAPRYFERVSNRDVLLRMQNNKKIRLLRGGRFADALDVVESMLLFAPGRATLWREAGMLHAKLDQIDDAVRALSAYLERATDDASRYRTSMLLQELLGRLD